MKIGYFKMFYVIIMNNSFICLFIFYLFLFIYLCKGPVTRSDIRKISNQIMKEKNILRVSFAYLIV